MTIEEREGLKIKTPGLKFPHWDHSRAGDKNSPGQNARHFMINRCRQAC
jgi:hypothetical protein